MRQSASRAVQKRPKNTRRSSFAEMQARIDALEAEVGAAREREVATAEVLQVINSSPSGLAPVFEAILEKAHNLCGVAHGALVLCEGETFRAVATHSYSGSFGEQLRQGYRGADNPITRALIDGERFLHIPDLSQIDHPMVQASVENAAVRTGLYVPLRKDGALLGMISSCRREIRPFSDKEIALLESFAAQAVIAMENARLLAETREALEQQTATAEVLQVINSSPGDLAPVFDAILKKARRLCGAAHGNLWTYDGERFHPAATHGSPRYAEWVRRRGPFLPEPGSTNERILQGESVIEILDLAHDPASKPDNRVRRDLIETFGFRTLLSVALRKEQTLLGVLHILRQEVRRFSAKEIALLQNFASQAVVAMENARLITETREALEQQTATAQVLQVINSSPGDLAPVFDAILDKGLYLCEAAFGTLWTFDGECFHAVALRRVPAGFAEVLTQAPYRPEPGSGHERLLRGAPYNQIEDAAAEASIGPIRRALVELGGARTVIAVPLLKDGGVLGAISAYRQEVRLFSDQQIALLQNFAAQAVIAMENARLITETREALEQQTATAEVLQVINSSPGDLTPVFNAILEKAHSLCGADFGALKTYDGEFFRHAAARSPSASPRYGELMQADFRPGVDSVWARLVSGERFVHDFDLAEIAAQASQERAPHLGALLEIGIRTQLIVPLRKDDRLLGAITANRREVRPFSNTQIALLENFAAQAVIAMENARLLTETREALEQQTATAEVLQVINSSPGDLTPVFDAMLDKAMRLCEAVYGELTTYDGERFHTAALRGVPFEYAEYKMDDPPNYGAGSVPMRLLAGERVVHITDLTESDLYRQGDPNRRALVDLGGARSLLTVPLLKDSTVLGSIMIYRHEVRLFTEKQIALLQNFAAQAVIAMENARLLGELRQRTSDLEESLEYQTATSDVLQVISRSTFDLQPVLDTLVETAARLCNADSAGIATRDGEIYRVTASYAASPEWNAFIRTLSLKPGRDTLTGRALLEREAVHIADITADAEYKVPEAVTVGNIRTNLGVPLLREGEPIGVMQLSRAHVEPFTERQIELVRTFADQAVIAIENTRLITETREALEQQTATAEILGIINSSPGDLAPVWDAMLEKATRLCEAASGILWTYNGTRFRAVAQRGLPDDVIQELQKNPIPTASLAAIARGEYFVRDDD
jgi:GAF domain-containing protein